MTTDINLILKNPKTQNNTIKLRKNKKTKQP